MARKTVLVSDISGRELSETDAAKLTIDYLDARRGRIVLDVAVDEVEELASKGQREVRRGRPRKVADS